MPDPAPPSSHAAIVSSRGLGLIILGMTAGAVQVDPAACSSIRGGLHYTCGNDRGGNALDTRGTATLRPERDLPDTFPSE